MGINWTTMTVWEINYFIALKIEMAASSKIFPGNDVIFQTSKEPVRSVVMGIKWKITSMSNEINYFTKLEPTLPASRKLFLGNNVIFQTLDKISMTCIGMNWKITLNFQHSNFNSWLSHYKQWTVIDLINVSAKNCAFSTMCTVLLIF